MKINHILAALVSLSLIVLSGLHGCVDRNYGAARDTGTNDVLIFDSYHNPRQSHERSHADAMLGWSFGIRYAMGDTNFALPNLSNVVDQISGSTNGCPKLPER